MSTKTYIPPDKKIEFLINVVDNNNIFIFLEAIFAFIYLAISLNSCFDNQSKFTFRECWFIIGSPFLLVISSLFKISNNALMLNLVTKIINDESIDITCFALEEACNSLKIPIGNTKKKCYFKMA